MKKIVSMLFLLAVATQADAYIYTFKNNFKKPIKVRVQLAGIFEPWYESDVIDKKGGSGSVRFVANEGSADMGRKFGFCLKDIQFALADGKEPAWQSIGAPVSSAKESEVMGMTGRAYLEEMAKKKDTRGEKKAAEGKLSDITGGNTCGNKNFELTQEGKFKLA